MVGKPAYLDFIYFKGKKKKGLLSIWRFCWSKQIQLCVVLEVSENTKLSLVAEEKLVQWHWGYCHAFSHFVVFRKCLCLLWGFPSMVVKPMTGNSYCFGDFKDCIVLLSASFPACKILAAELKCLFSTQECGRWNHRVMSSFWII